MIFESCKSYAFECKDRWAPVLQGKVLEAPPGSWIKPRPEDPPDYLAILCCPSCKKLAALSSLVHKIDQKGHVETKKGEPFECPHCNVRLAVLLNAWGKSTLYGIAFEQNQKPAMRYLFAVDGHDAKKQFRVSRSHVKIVAIGPVLGYYVPEKDKDEKVLSVS